MHVAVGAGEIARRQGGGGHGAPPGQFVAVDERQVLAGTRVGQHVRGGQRRPAELGVGGEDVDKLHPEVTALGPGGHEQQRGAGGAVHRVVMPVGRVRATREAGAQGGDESVELQVASGLFGGDVEHAVLQGTRSCVRFGGGGAPRREDGGATRFGGGRGVGSGAVVRPVRDRSAIRYETGGQASSAGADTRPARRPVEHPVQGGQTSGARAGRPPGAGPVTRPVRGRCGGWLGRSGTCGRAGRRWVRRGARPRRRVRSRHSSRTVSYTHL